MIECKYNYTNSLLDKISKNSVKNINLFSEIAMFIILVGAVILFVTGNIVLGSIFLGIFVLLLISLIYTNKTIVKSNRILNGQQVQIVFNEYDMAMTTSLGNKVLYNATFDYKAIKKVSEKQDLIYVYFDKTSVIVIPKLSFKTNEDYLKATQLINNNYVV
ncbi:MAG: YcxB family protein [Clostridia bacterium]|nr:YcxB family protein [Clostridia bacterium]